MTVLLAALLGSITLTSARSSTSEETVRQCVARSRSAYYGCSTTSLQGDRGAVYLDGYRSRGSQRMRNGANEQAESGRGNTIEALPASQNDDRMLATFYRIKR